MEARIARLEKDVDGLLSMTGKLVTDVAEIKGKLSNMPTTFQMVSFFLGTAIGLAGLVFAIAKFVKP